MLTYPELLRVYADVVSVSRVQVPLPWMPAGLMGSIAGALTDKASASPNAGKNPRDVINPLHSSPFCYLRSARSAPSPEGCHGLGRSRM